MSSLDFSDVPLDEEDGRPNALAQLREVREAQHEARRALVAAKSQPGSVSRSALQQANAALEGFILAIEPLLRDQRFTDADYYREQVEFAEVKTADGQQTLRGLLTVVQEDGFYVEVEETRPGRGGGADAEVKKRPFPVGVLKNAYRQASFFLQKNALGVPMDGEVDRDGGIF